MGITIKIPSILTHLTGYRDSVEVNGTTVRECMNDLISQYPDSREWFDTENPTLWVALNQELVYLTETDKKVTEGDELSLILVIGGG
jgi:molybdopterin converting factor small subunit